MDDIKTKLNLYLYYILVFILSLLIMTVAPMFSPSANTDLGLEAIFPHTPVGWAIYVCTKLFVGAVNMLIFHCFVKQANVNVKDNANYIEASKIYGTYHPKEYNPRSPKEFFGQLYGRKGVTLFLTSVLSSIVLTNAILSFDMTAFVSYCMTVAVGIIFGILVMKNVEVYWTVEFYDSAIKLQNKYKKQEDLAYGYTGIRSEESQSPSSSGLSDLPSRQ